MMKFIKTMLFVILIGILCNLSYAQATQGKGKMRGIVLDKQTGQPLEGVTVKLFNVRAASFHNESPQTDKDGTWRAVFVRGGLWNIDFQKVGYQMTKISYTVPTQMGAKTAEIRVEMIKVQGPQLDEGVAKEIEKGQKLVTESKFDEALVVFEGVLTQFKDSEGVAIVNMYIGNCYSAKEDFNKAIAAYKRALEQYPTSQDLIVSIGNSYNNLNQSQEAMSWFSKIPFEELTNIDTLYNLGTNFYNTQKYDLAIKYYSRATVISPDFAPAWYQLGLTYTAMEKKQDAIVSLKKFMELDPESADFETAKAIVEAFEAK